MVKITWQGSLSPRDDSSDRPSAVCSSFNASLELAWALDYSATHRSLELATAAYRGPLNYPRVCSYWIVRL